MQSQQMQVPRSDSPQDGARHPPHIQGQDSMYNIHSNELDLQKSQASSVASKSNNAYPRNPGPFSSFPNTTRPRQMSAYRDSASSFYNNPNATDLYSPGLTSPTQSHIQQQFLESRSPYDFSNSIHKQTNYNQPVTEPYSTLHKATPQQQHNSYPSPNPHYSNNVTLSSQTPFGPHIPVNPAINGNGGLNGGITSHQGLSTGAGQPQPQEDISTIFVVGFPDDMQEREFQNMFTFSSGFEAATLKIPNKEYTSYGNMPISSRQFSADPYASDREQPIPSWGEDNGAVAMPPGPHASNGLGVPPRKQIIGFAKFRSKEEALVAKDLLQGKRVDIEKGAVLKAEMAKKNLHTKRGVGPIPPGIALPSVTAVVGPALGQASLVSGVQNNTANVNGLQQHGMNGLNHGQQEMYPMSSDPLNSRDTTQQQLGAIGAPVGLSRIASAGPWPDSPPNGQAVGMDRRDSMLNGIASNNRGARERAEEDDRRRRDKDLRLRQGPMNTFDAFNAIPQPVSRQPHGATNGSGLNSSTVETPSINTFSSHPNIHPAYFSPCDDTSTVGPWDHVGRSNTVTMRPSHSSRHSPAPSESHRTFTPPVDALPQSIEHQQSTESQSSSTAGSQQAQAHEVDLTKAVGGLALSTSRGNTSPQLPSPASGGSSHGSGRNGVDQNPPINTLYVGNLPTSPPPPGLPPGILEESLRELFEKCPGFRRLSFKQKSSGPMCFVEFEDVSHASRTLNDLYGNTLNGLVKGGGIRLSYSKNPLGVRTPTSANANGASFPPQQAYPGNCGTFIPDDRRRSGMPSLASPPIQSSQFIATNSQPPRFFASPSNGTFAPPNQAPSDAYLQRNNNGGMYAYSLAPLTSHHASGSTSFSPFGMSNSHSNSMIPDQKDSEQFNNNDQYTYHTIPRTLSPPTQT